MLIPKPKGLAGRAPPKGYNLQDEMGLGDNRRRYNKFAVSLVSSFAISHQLT